jgi:hypothetical protein
MSNTIGEGATTSRVLPPPICNTNILTLAPRAAGPEDEHACYDTFISDTGGSPCEVAWLSSNEDVNVRVLCPPTNIGTIKVSDPARREL